MTAFRVRAFGAIGGRRRILDELTRYGAMRCELICYDVIYIYMYIYIRYRMTCTYTLIFDQAIHSTILAAKTCEIKIYIPRYLDYRPREA